jgi:hypothetical protein
MDMFLESILKAYGVDPSKVEPYIQKNGTPELKEHRDPEELVSTPEAAKILTVKEGTLEVWRSLGKGPKYTKIQRCVRYRIKDLYDFIQQSEFRSTSEYKDKDA